jgi:hypothetical protein
LWTRPETYPRMKHLIGVSFGYASALQNYTILERLASDKH